jgi:hypothetical protein
MIAHYIDLNFSASLKSFDKFKFISTVLKQYSSNFTKCLLFSDSGVLLDKLEVPFPKYTYHKFIKEKLNIHFASFHAINRFFEERGLPKFKPFQMVDFIDLLDNNHLYGKINLSRVLDRLDVYSFGKNFDPQLTKEYLNWLKTNELVDFLEGLKIAEQNIKDSTIELYEAIFVYPIERVSIHHWKFLKALNPKYLYLLGDLRNDVLGLTKAWKNEIHSVINYCISPQNIAEHYIEINEVEEILELKPDVIVVNTLEEALQLSEQLKAINCPHGIFFENILTPKIRAVWQAFLALTKEHSTLEEVAPLISYLPSMILPFKKEKLLSSIKTSPINKAKLTLYPAIYNSLVNLFKNNSLSTILELINCDLEDKKIWRLIESAPHLWYDPIITITTATRLTTRINCFVSKTLSLGDYLINRPPIVSNTRDLVYIA